MLFLALYLASIIACLSEQSEMHEKQQTERHNLKQRDSEQGMECYHPCISSSLSRCMYV